MKYQNVILTLDFTLQDENIWKRKMWCERQIEDQEISSFACLITWYRLDNVHIKQTSSIVLKQATWMARYPMTANKR